LNDKRTFYGVQVLRGVAACLVVAFHVTYNLRNDSDPAWLPVPYFGNGGVDLFFLISGFVIVWTTKDRWQEKGAWTEFLRRRMTRIFPLYWLVTSAKVAGLLLVPFLLKEPIVSIWNVMASYLLIPSWYSYGEAHPVISAGWTLCFEMFFYYMCAACLIGRAKPAIAITPIFVVLAIIGCFRTTTWGAVATLLDPLLLEFVAGMWVAELVRSGWRGPGLRATVLLLAVGCVGLVASDALPTAREYQLRVIVWGLPSLAILLSFVALESRLDFQSLRILLLIGDASYSIYLTHVIALQPLIGILRRQPFGVVGEWCAFVIAMGVGVVLGVIVYYYVERPLLRAFSGTPRVVRSAPAYPPVPLQGF
jgi:exopolysaccharide production protein ExoZ